MAKKKPAKKPKDALTSKQRAFCQQYVIDRNATQAAIRAGYSPKTAKEIGYENLTKPHFQVEITKLTEELEKASRLKAEDVIKGFEAMALGQVVEKRTRVIKKPDEIIEETTEQTLIANGFNKLAEHFGLLKSGNQEGDEAINALTAIIKAGIQKRNGN